VRNLKEKFFVPMLYYTTLPKTISSFL